MSQKKGTVDAALRRGSVKIDGWFECEKGGRRAFTVIRDEEGRPVRFRDIKSGHETEADPPQFTGTNWIKIDAAQRGAKRKRTQRARDRSNRPKASEE